jgi:putative membrane protein
MFDTVINSLPAFAGFFLTALVLLAGFITVYLMVTPYKELALIRAGNEAAALSLGGVVIGFALPIAVSVAVSHDLYAMIGWGVVAGVVQLLAYVVARLALPRLNEHILQGRAASGILVASLAIGVGILNAGCIV